MDYCLHYELAGFHCDTITNKNGFMVLEEIKGVNEAADLMQKCLELNKPMICMLTVSE
jgi:hypothetical protein